MNGIILPIHMVLYCLYVYHCIANLYGITLQICMGLHCLYGLYLWNYIAYMNGIALQCMVLYCLYVWYSIASAYIYAITLLKHMVLH